MRESVFRVYWTHPTNDNLVIATTSASRFSRRVLCVSSSQRGGKQKLAREIVELMPAHYSYLEPFAGGAAVLFAKRPCEREMLNDLDGLVMRFWRVVRDRPEELAAAVAATPYSREEWNEYRTIEDQETDDDLEAARRLVLNVDQSFCRSRSAWCRPTTSRDRKGRWQPGTWASMPDRILHAVERLRGVCLENWDALELIPRWDHRDTVIYCDPPYVGEHRRDRDRHCYTHDAGDDLWPRLVEVLLQIRHAHVLLSGYPCDEINGLVESGWREVSLRARRSVQNGSSGALDMAPEHVWLSPNMPEPHVSTLWEEAII